MGDDWTGEGPRYSVICTSPANARAAHPNTKKMRTVSVDRATHDRYLRAADTSSLPCPK